MREARSGSLVRSTYIMFVPTNSGAVVAADSRVGNVNQTQYCDDIQKVFPVDGAPSPTVVFATGLTGAYEPSKDPDYCRHIREAKVLFDLPTETTAMVKDQKVGAGLLRLLDLNVTLSNADLYQNPELLQEITPNIGRDVGTLAVASYYSAQSKTVLQFARFKVATGPTIEIHGERIEEFFSDQPRTQRRFGETEFELWSKVGDGVDQEGGISWG